MEKAFLCKTPEETFELGKEIGKCLSGGEVILLFGGLGSGKTLLTKGIVSSLGYDENDVNSPSFTLVNTYEAEKGRVYHLDLWRLSNELDVGFSTGLDEILSGEAIVIIEWAEKLSNYDFDRSKSVEIRIEEDEDERRKITISGRLVEDCIINFVGKYSEYDSPRHFS
ncbi:MAG: tRNA (adenosine(37)-N6)-threonylcarbamoyltransferase complex ATPase subunit type 1 TsaE [Pyrinomonadaceae bacterium]|nr:tRNA (adenosine(37)-N6)-threonylcarbamoyltransferase complex ATPase subunit type 1 TsaE [Pyrinomonadaceae bacterium]MCX7639751.1 tRNA (adenosine(37)-N6)-threonylcarbamoyltransferase complex ATPase subunit type 1 TsaE [Pyrinomonadaceae bacterium]MDW8304334.1 tRNA (adenosine(37)-N6)-threonylcarbamoyltransferase complex ATPase subunit type 1 TsaE [Acidobacteriota bacterium]